MGQFHAPVGSPLTASKQKVSEVMTPDDGARVTLHRLVVIQRARQTRFTLTEIKHLFFGFRAGTPPSVRWKKLKKRKIVELNAMSEHIQTMRDLLDEQGKCRCTALEELREEDVREAVCTAAVLVSGKLHVLIGTHDPQHEPHRSRELPSRGIMHDVRRGKLIFLSASL